MQIPLVFEEPCEAATRQSHPNGAICADSYFSNVRQRDGLRRDVNREFAMCKTVKLLPKDSPKTCPVPIENSVWNLAAVYCWLEAPGIHIPLKDLFVPRDP